MEWIDKIIWTQLAKSLASFTVALVLIGLAAYRAGFWEGYKAGLAEGLNLLTTTNDIINSLAEEVMNLTREIEHLSLLVRNLSSPHYHQP
jgi:hypothetical protein